MRFILIENILLEGKNIERTWNQYKDKLVKIVGDEKGSKNLFDYIIGQDPTYIEGSSTTGEFGVWLLNLFCRGDKAVVNNGYDLNFAILSDYRKSLNLIGKI